MIPPPPLILLSEALAPPGLAASDGFALHRYHDRATFRDGLRQAPALVILHAAADAAWRAHALAVKTRAASRRTPVIVVGVSDDAARVVGADAALDALPPEGLPALAARWARTHDDDTLAALVDACAGPLPPLAQEGVRLFNAGHYYPQHDRFEALWIATPGPERDLYQGILQVGVAYYQVLRGNRRGALKMLGRALPWLAALPDVCQGVDVAALRRDTSAVQTALRALPADTSLPSAFDSALLKPVRWAPTP